MTKDLEHNLRFGFLIHDVSRMRRVVVDRALKPLGLTRSQWWVLAFLSRRDGMTQTALAADLDLTKVAIGKLVDRMEAAGLLERRADKRDARARRIYLSSAGQRLVKSIRDAVDVVEAEITASISEQELTLTSSILTKVKGRLTEMIGNDQAALPDAAE